jgi:hypothetical protein
VRKCGGEIAWLRARERERERETHTHTEAERIEAMVKLELTTVGSTRRQVLELPSSQVQVMVVFPEQNLFGDPIANPWSVFFRNSVFLSFFFLMSVIDFGGGFLLLGE